MGETFTAFDGTRSFCRPIQYSEGLCKLPEAYKDVSRRYSDPARAVIRLFRSGTITR